MKAGYDREPGNEPNAGAIPLAEDEDHARRLVRSGFTLSIVWLLFLVFPIAGLYEMRADLSRFLPAAAGLGVFVAIYVWAARHAVRAVAGMEAPLGAATRNVVLTTLAVLAVVLSLAYGENWVGPLGFVGILAGLTLRFRTVAAVSVAITGLTAVTAVVVDLGWGPSVSIAIYSGLAGLIAFGVRWLVKTNLELREARREVARLAVSEERLRLSREIHDTLTQGFASIIISLHPLRRSIEEQDVTDPYLEQIEATARESLEEARRLVWALRPGPLQKAPLPEAVSRIARSFSEESGVSADASVTGTPVPLAPEVEVGLLRAVQEALQNVRKHARASRAAVTLSYLGDAVALDVRDDGAGFDVNTLPGSGGLGLVGMRERVETLGGTFEIETRPGEETVISVCLPVTAYRLSQLSAKETL